MDYFPRMERCFDATSEEATRFYMKHMINRMRQFVRSEDGPIAVEYAVMLALIIVVCLVAITTLGSNAKATFNDIATSLGS